LAKAKSLTKDDNRTLQAKCYMLQVEAPTTLRFGDSLVSLRQRVKSCRSGNTAIHPPDLTIGDFREGGLQATVYRFQVAQSWVSLSSP